MRVSETVAVAHVLCTPQRTVQRTPVACEIAHEVLAQTLRALFQCLIGWIVTGLSLHSRELITSMLQSLAFASVPWQAECHLHPLDWPLYKLINSWSNYECFCTLCHDAPHQQQQRIGCVSVFSEACFLADTKDKASWCHWLNELSV